MSTSVPPGWPEAVHPPGADRFTETALAWLLEIVPPEYRRYGVLRRHPVALARMARHHVDAAIDAARTGFRTARVDLGGALPPHAVDAVLDTYRTEGARLVALLGAVEAVERALRAHEPPTWPRPEQPEQPHPSTW